MSAIRFHQIMKQYGRKTQLNRDIIREITSTYRRFGGVSMY